MSLKAGHDQRAGSSSLLERIRTRVKREGLTGLLKWIRFRAAEEVGDWRLGIATKGYITSKDLGLTLECNDYEPTRYIDIWRAFRYIKVQSHDVLLDYGAGMGRVVCTASRHAFRKIIGLEISAELSAIARRNVAKVNGRVCKDVTVITGNAIDYVPPDDVTVVFLFNPFGPSVVDVVAQNLRSSLERSPRQLTVIYLFWELEGNHLSNCDWLTLKAELPAEEDDVRLFVYEYEPH